MKLRQSLLIGVAAGALFPAVSLAQCANGILANCPPAVSLQSTDVLYGWQFGQTPHSRSMTVSQVGSAALGTTFASPPPLGNVAPNWASLTTASISGLATLLGGVTVTGLGTFNANLNVTGSIAAGGVSSTGFSTFSAGVTVSSLFDSGLLTASALAAFNGGVTASALFDTGLSTFSGLASFNGGVTASSLFDAGLSTFSGLASFSGGITASSLYVQGQATFSGVVTATSGVAGNTSGTSASTGIVGQVLTTASSASTSVSLTANQVANVVSMALPAGDWDCWGAVIYQPTVTTSISSLTVGVSTASASFAPAPYGGYVALIASFTAGFGDQIPTGMTVIEAASSETVYLVTSANFGVAAMGAYGQLTCRRMR